jgi:hypothetical protein
VAIQPGLPSWLISCFSRTPGRSVAGGAGGQLHSSRFSHRAPLLGRHCELGVLRAARWKPWAAMAWRSDRECSSLATRRWWSGSVPGRGVPSLTSPAIGRFGKCHVSVAPPRACLPGCPTGGPFFSTVRGWSARTSDMAENVQRTMPLLYCCLALFAVFSTVNVLIVMALGCSTVCAPRHCSRASARHVRLGGRPALF